LAVETAGQLTVSTIINKKKADNNGGWAFNESYLIQQLILKAQALGADGVVLGDRSESTVGSMGTAIGPTYHATAYQRIVVRGTAIVRIR